MEKNHNEKPNTQEFEIGDMVVTNRYHSYEGRILFGRDLRKILKPVKILSKSFVENEDKEFNFVYDLGKKGVWNGAFLEIFPA